MNLKKLGSRGAVAIEAAIVLPLLISIMFATMETYQYYRAVSIMDRAVFSVADGIAMQTELRDDGDCQSTDNICTYGVIIRDLMRPLDYNNDGEMDVRLFVAQTTGSGGSARTDWRNDNTNGWSKRCLGSGVCQDLSNIGSGGSLPAGIPNPLANDTVLMVQVKLKYEPFVVSSVFWERMGGVRQLSSTAFFRPRFDDLLLIN